MALVQSDVYKGRGGKREGAGRPKKEVHRVRFQVSCQPDERETLERKAKAAGMSLSKFIISAALNA